MAGEMDNHGGEVERLERELGQTRQILDELQRVGRLGHWTLDIETWHFEWSEGVFQIWDRDPDLGSPSYRECLDTVHPDDRDILRRAGERAVADVQSFEVEHRIRRPSGELRWVRLQGRVLVREGQMTGAVHDITEHRHLETQLRQSQKMEAVGRLAGGIAHDFNNLLTVIFSFTELAMSGLPAEDARFADLAEVMRAAERAEQLTSQLLAFSRRRAVHPELLDVNETLADIGRMLRPLLGEAVEYVVDTCDTSTTVEIDPGALEQVLVNLAVNARDAMPNGGRLTIRTDCRRFDAHWNPTVADFVEPGSYVAIEVEDEGCGMEPQTVSSMFEPFFTTKRAGEGTGLGLATCLGIVQQAGGHVGVDTAIDRGTTVTVYLPLVRSRGASDEAPESVRGLAGSESILVVEDNDQVRTLAERVLQHYGYVVVSAASGKAALDYLDDCSERFDLLLTDVVMPHMNGRELADIVLDRFPRTRLLFMSGYTGDTITDRGVLEYGVHLLQKPFTPERLVAAVRATLDDSGPTSLH